MIDLHCHLLPGLDDGAQTLADSLAMARLALEGGTTVVAATPHANFPGNDCPPEALEAALLLLKTALQEEGLPLTVLRGMEIFSVGDEVKRLFSHELYTLNRSNYALVEFAFDESPRVMNGRLLALQDAGILPVVAHPERYYAVQDDPRLAFDWVQNGILLQGNKGSVLGDLGDYAYRTAWTLLSHRLYACLASDAHAPDFRTPHFGRLVDALEQTLPESAVFALLQQNPARILQNRPLPPAEAVPFDDD